MWRPIHPCRAVRTEDMRERQVSTTRIVEAAPATIWDIITDPTMHPVIDGSGTVKAALGNPKRLGPNSKFGMSMKMGLPYPIRNKVVEYVEGRRIAWQHFSGHRWRWELEEVEGGTRVTETFDWSTARSPQAIESGGFPEKNLRGMEATLERLAEVVAEGRAA